MIRLKKMIFTVLITVIFVNFVSGQGPWTLPKGKAFLQIGFTGLYYDKIQFDGLEKSLSGKIIDNTIQVYSEYGISNNLELALIIPYKSINFLNNTNNSEDMLTGFSNISIGLKYKLYDNRWKISSGLIFSANTISKKSSPQLSSGFNAATIVPYIAAGSSTEKWYYFANIGYGYMNNDYSDFFKTTIEIGYRVIKNGHLIFSFDSRSVVSKEAAFENDKFQWPSYLDRQAYNAIGLKANYEFKKNKIGTNVAIIGASSIDNAPLAPTFNIGIYAKL